MNKAVKIELSIKQIKIQSFNPVGKENIDSLLKSYRKHYESKNNRRDI